MTTATMADTERVNDLQYELSRQVNEQQRQAAWLVCWWLRCDSLQRARLANRRAYQCHEVALLLWEIDD